MTAGGRESGAPEGPCPFGERSRPLLSDLEWTNSTKIGPVFFKLPTGSVESRLRKPLRRIAIARPINAEHTASCPADLFVLYLLLFPCCEVRTLKSGSTEGKIS